MRRVATFAMLLLCLFGCDKPSPETAQTPPTASQTTAPEPPPAEPSADPSDLSAFKAEDWCPRAHDDTVKIVDAMKATMKRAGQEIKDESQYAPPERAAYLTLCEKLPLPMKQCLVVGYAAKNREACQTALDELDADQKAAYGELMGK